MIVDTDRRGCVLVLVYISPSSHSGSLIALGSDSSTTPYGTTPDCTLYQPPAGCWCPTRQVSPAHLGVSLPSRVAKTPATGSGLTGYSRTLVLTGRVGQSSLHRLPNFLGPFKPPEFTAPRTPSVTKYVCYECAGDSMWHYVCIIIIATWQVVEAMWGVL